MLTSVDRVSGAAPGQAALAWTRARLVGKEWLVRVPPACAGVMAEMRAKIEDGPGFAVLNRIPVEAYRREEGQAIGWVLANLIGRIVAQKRDGTRLYDVRDTGQAIAHGVRRSITNLEQEFHTDGGWLPLTPSLIGLYCLQPAAEGGMSRCVSLVTAHIALRDCPELLERLHEPFWWDRQAEHAKGEVTHSGGPVYWREGERIFARYYDDYVRKGHLLAGELLDSAGHAALEAMREVVEAEENRLEFHLERGQFLYVNNRQIAHSRTAFRDDDAKRHLMRFWNREEGSPDLEGGAPS